MACVPTNFTLLGTALSTSLANGRPEVAKTLKMIQQWKVTQTMDVMLAASSWCANATLKITDVYDVGYF